jgi:hypothetical protein
MLALPRSLDQLFCWLRVKSAIRTSDPLEIASAVVAATARVTRHLVTASRWGLEVMKGELLKEGNNSQHRGDHDSFCSIYAL